VGGVKATHVFGQKGENLTGIKIEVRNNNVEKALRVLKKKLMKDGVMKELKMRQYYEKPSDRRVRKKKEMVANWKKKQRLLEKFKD
jgi:small subunit ribosomal protein S21